MKTNYAPFRAIINTKGKAVDGASGTFPILVSGFAKPGPLTINRGNMIANDFISSRLAMYLGLPTPPSSLLQVEGVSLESPYFSTLNFAPLDGNIPLIDPAHFVDNNEFIATGIVVFDIFIANPDRHGGNIHYNHTDPALGIYIFDHGHSLLGYESGVGMKRLDDIKNRLGCTGGAITKQNRHILIDHIKNSRHIDDWIQRIKLLPDYQIDDLCDHKYDIGINDLYRIAIKKFLKDRRDKIDEIIAKNHHEFPGITQWGIPPIHPKAV
jgi:hypothetical protein